jgi:predicted SPOUT superfamily RNA methylase MTH1
VTNLYYAFRLLRAGNANAEQKSVKKVSIAIPASVVSDTPHLREKTAKIGTIGRAAAIFRVNEIIVYPDNPKTSQKAETSLIALLLSYMETPQYLRKRLFRLNPDLQYAGILPPLRTCHHPLNSETRRLKIGEFREGTTVSQTKEGTLVDVGVEKPALVPNERLSADKRVTVKIRRIDGRLEAELTSRDEIAEYWGYDVVVEERLFGEIVGSRGFDLKIATSRLGVSFSSVADAVAERWKNANSVLVAFGAPTRGLHEIAKQEGLRIDDVVDFVVNTILNQGTETVRTEEAVFASLAVLNTLVFKA